MNTLLHTRPCPHTPQSPLGSLQGSPFVSAPQFPPAVPSAIPVSLSLSPTGSSAVTCS